MNPTLLRKPTEDLKKTQKLIRLVALTLLLAAGTASADLMLHPTRIVLEPNQRAAQLEIINNGSETATYRIALVNRRMNDTGSIQAVTDPRPGELFADSLLRYSPRQVTLQPGAGQTVRVMVRKPGNLAEGEYRSHLLFSKQPDARPGSSAADASNNEIGIVLQTLIGVSIPVIVRHGQTAAELTIANPDLQYSADGTPVLNFQLARSGNESVYGDLAVTHTPANGPAQVLARANGLAVYVPNPSRQVAMKLALPDHSGLLDGTLRVTFREQVKDGGKLLSEVMLSLP